MVILQPFNQNCTFMKKIFREYKAWALITGAASGMGRIYCQRLALMGYNIVAVDINRAGLEETMRIVNDQVAVSDTISAEFKSAFKAMTEPTINNNIYPTTENSCT